jgi:hypothetical protein
MKAILEMEMPESCYVCRLCYCHIANGLYICNATNKEIVPYKSKRREDCPLKPKEELYDLH